MAGFTLHLDDWSPDPLPAATSARQAQPVRGLLERRLHAPQQTLRTLLAELDILWRDDGSVVLLDRHRKMLAQFSGVLTALPDTRASPLALKLHYYILAKALEMRDLQLLKLMVARLYAHFSDDLMAGRSLEWPPLQMLTESGNERAVTVAQLAVGDIMQHASCNLFPGMRNECVVIMLQDLARMFGPIQDYLYIADLSNAQTLILLQTGWIVAESVKLDVRATLAALGNNALEAAYWCGAEHDVDPAGETRTSFLFMLWLDSYIMGSYYIIRALEMELFSQGLLPSAVLFRKALRKLNILLELADEALHLATLFDEGRPQSAWYRRHHAIARWNEQWVEISATPRSIARPSTHASEPDPTPASRPPSLAGTKRRHAPMSS